MTYRVVFTISIIVILVGFFAQSLLLNSNTANNKTLGTVDRFKLASIEQPSKKFGKEIFKDKLVLLNVWASWCGSCASEVNFFKKIGEEYPNLKLIGINFRDETEDAKAWLEHYGNPFSFNLHDRYGEFAVKIGLYGTPETILIKNNKILARHSGLLDHNIWNKKFARLASIND